MDKLIFGCGYLGMRVAQRWLDAGHRVWASTRSPARAAELQGVGLHPLVCDVLEPRTLEKLPPVETILYCIGFDRSAGRTMREVYVQGLANVLPALMKDSARFQRFLYVSSTSVYGQPNGEWVDEYSRTEPLSEAGRTVLEAEQTLRASVHRDKAIFLRFAGIYGPGRLIRAEALKAGQPISGDPEHWLNLIHADDGASVILAAEEHGEPQATYNVSDGEPVRRRAFYEFLADLIGTPPPRFDMLVGTSTRPAASRDLTNRRIRNAKMKRCLPVSLRFPSYREGLRASLPRLNS